MSKTQKNAYNSIKRKVTIPYGVIENIEQLEFMKIFLESLKDKKYSPMSVEKRRDCIRNLLAWFRDEGIDRVQNVDFKTLENYHKNLLKKEYSPHSINSFLHSCKQFFSFLAAEGVLFFNPAENWKFKKPKLKLGTVLTEDEIKKLLSISDISSILGLRNRAILEVLYSCGLRKTELINMKVEDAAFYDQSIRIKGKGRKERIIPIGKHAEKYVKLYLKNARPQLIKNESIDSLWISRNHKPMSGITLLTIVRNAGKEAGIEKKVNNHTIRRTCATHLLQNGAYPLMVSKLLGHSDLKTLSHYLKITISDLKKCHKTSKPGR